MNDNLRLKLEDEMTYSTKIYNVANVVRVTRAAIEFIGMTAHDRGGCADRLQEKIPHDLENGKSTIYNDEDGANGRYGDLSNFLLSNFLAGRIKKVCGTYGP